MNDVTAQQLAAAIQALAAAATAAPPPPAAPVTPAVPLSSCCMKVMPSIFPQGLELVSFKRVVNP